MTWQKGTPYDAIVNDLDAAGLVLREDITALQLHVTSLHASRMHLLRAVRFLMVTQALLATAVIIALALAW